MTDRIRPGLRPHELLAQKPADKKDANAPLSAEAETAVTDVLEMAHRQAKETQSVRFKKTEARAHLARYDAVAKKDGKLFVGGEAFPLKAAMDQSFTLLEPNEKAISHIARGLASGEATLISAAVGAGAAFTARWYLEASGQKYEMARITRATALDMLVGSMRPDENKKLRVVDGPLTRCIRDGGVFVLDGLENADPQIIATLRSLAKGAKHFHHPVSGQVIPVNENFRLVMIGDQSKRFDKNLVEATNHRELRAYDRDEHARLLIEQHGLPRTLANTLATFHETLQTEESGGRLGFGRGFPLAWPLLSAVGARLSKKREVSNDDVINALWGVYGARLANPDNIVSFEQLVADLKMGELGKTRPKRSSDPSFVHTAPVDRALFFSEAALNAGEALLLTHAGQSGATRLVSELASRRGQELVTIVGHSGTDPQSLMETPVFNEKGELYFRPGRLAQSLIEGKMIYVDHIDHMPRDRQNAFFQLRNLKSIKVVEDGKIVEKPIHKNARIVLSATEGQVRGRSKPDPADRASVTEVRLTAPVIDDLVAFIPADVKEKALVERFARALHAEEPKYGLTKLQRFIDFARTTELLSQEMHPEEAALTAARLLFNIDPKASAAYQALEAEAQQKPAHKKKNDARPLWMRLLDLTPEEEKRRLKASGYRITGSMRPHLDALAIAYRLGRPVLAVGPASSGKTALGIVFSALVEKKNIRVNFSASTESRTLLGGLGPVNEQGKTVFRHVEGPEMQAAQLKAMLMADEFFLSREGQMSLKSWADHRGKVIDAEADLERDVGTAFLYATTNPEDPKTGRTAPPPAITDCMFHIVVGAKPIEEKVEIVESQCGVERSLIEKTASFFADLEKSVRGGALKSAVGPITCTERDMLKAARTAEYMFKRDGIKDPEEQRRILGREVYRLVRDILLDDGDRKVVFEKLIGKHFGKDVEPSARPAEVKRVEVVENGEKVTYLQIGAARLKIRPNSGDEEIEKLVPDLDGVRNPVGEQFEFLESVLLALELKQPLAVVGTTGTGKTMLMKYLAHHLNMPWREDAYHSDMTEDHLFGTTVVSKDGNVEFQYSKLSSSIKYGGLYVGDEFLTLPNSTREKLNPLTEGSELQISQKRPPETIEKKDWDENFNFVVTTNGSDIRDDGFSDAEASRMRIVGLRELSSAEDLRTIAERDYVVKAPEYTAPSRTEESRTRVAAELKKLVDQETPFGRVFAEAIAASLEGKDPPAIDRAKLEAPELELDQATIKLLADAFNIFTYDKKDASLRAVLNAALEQLPDGAESALLELATLVPASSFSTNVRALAEGEAVRRGRLINVDEADIAVDFFVELRELQKKSKFPGTSPLTPRIFSSFMELFTTLRGRTSAAAAAQRAAELSLWSKLGPQLEGEATKRLVAAFGQNDRPIEKYTKPDQVDGGVWFGDSFIEYGNTRPWTMDSARFPPTPARCKNLTLIADAVSLCKGRPVSCTDDENGETVETWREFGRLTGRQVTVVSLPPNVDIESLIEKLVASEKAADKGGFEAELQQIGQAVREGHILVLRGCGNVPTAKLERLNSLGDGRQGVALPRSGEWLKAAPGFRMVMLRTPDAVHEYSPALQNRLIEPLLTTRSSGANLEGRAAELALAIEERTKISREAAQLLGSFHTFTNQLIRERKFASGGSVGSLLNRDAEAIGFRLKWLQDRNVVDDEKEMLAYLINELYGERFLPAKDKETLKKELDDWFGVDWSKIELSSEINPSPHVMRVGDWVVARDPGGIRQDVPGPEAILPPTKSLDRIFQKTVAAAQFGEVLQLHGDEFVADACVNTLARITTSPVTPVEGNEELQEAYLFGGLIQDAKTGEFKEHEGLVWKAQREGGTLLIRNASKIPAEVLTRLVEIAATRHVTRVHDGKLEVKKAAFRLILQTSAGDPPLIRELASLCTKVQCPEVTERADLKILLTHLLQGVPGSAELAGALEKFADSARDALAERAQMKRQPVKFDSARLLKAARQIAREIKDQGRSIEEALADVIGRLYLRPAEGLEIDEKLDKYYDQLTETLNGVLTLNDVAPIDIVERPEISSLRKDYDEASPAFTAELLRATIRGIEAALTRSSTTQIKSALFAVLESGLLPQAAAARVQKALEKIGPKLNDEATAELNSVIRSLQKAVAAGAAETPFHDSALDFLRGARMWDFEYRMAILSRYETAFTALGTAGSTNAADRIADIDRVRERFAAADAHTKLTSIRDAVGAAMLKYRDRAGEADEQLGQLLRDLLDKWHLVGTSPIFKNHHQLRNELTSLDQLLEKLEAAHASRGATQEGEVAALVDALRDAGEKLERIRLAEASAELRRGMKRAEMDTATLVQSVRGELTEIRKLEGAEKTHNELTRAMSSIQMILESSDFLHLDYQKDTVERPELRSDAAIREEATRRARTEVAEVMATRRMEVLAELQKQNAPRKTPTAAGFFEGFSVSNADLGMTLDPDPVAASDALLRYQGATAALATEEEKLVAKKTKEIFDRLKANDQDRASQIYKDRVHTRARNIAAQVSSSIVHLDRELNTLKNNLNLEQRAPELAKELAAARRDLEETSKRAHSWSRAISEGIAEAGRVMLQVATFGFFGAKKSDLVAEEDLALDAAQKRVARVLHQIQEKLQQEDGSLPDFRKIVTHKEVTTRLTEQLMMVETLGDLAAKYARLASLHQGEDNNDLKRWLNSVLGQMASERQLREVLLRIDAFCTSANKLSSEGPQQDAVAVAPALEAVMRAAEAIRTQSVSQGSYRTSVKALRNALAKIDELAAEQKTLPPLISAVRQEISDLFEAFRQLSGEKEGNLDYDMSAVQSILRARTKQLDSREDLAEELRSVFDDPAELDETHDEAELEARKTEAALERALDRGAKKTRRELEEESFARETKLQMIDVSFDRARELVVQPVDEAEDKKVEEISREVLLRRESVIASARAIEANAVEALGWIGRDRESIGKLLGELDGALASTAIDHWRKELEAAGTMLEQAAIAGGDGLRGFNVRKPLEALRRIAKALRAMGQVPVEVSSRLDAIIDAARPLEAAFGTERFVQLASTWCADALLAARNVEAKLGELERGDGDASNEARITRLFEELSPTVERLGAANERIGAWSRLSLCSHVEQRVAATQAALPEGAKVPAAALIEKAHAAANAQAGLALGTDAEQCAADAYAAYVDLADKLIKGRKLEESIVTTYSSLGELLWSLLGPQKEEKSASGSGDGSPGEGAKEKGVSFPSLDLDTCAQAIELVEKLAKVPGVDRVARELSLSLGGLRTAALERAMDEIEGSFYATSAAYVGTIKDARVRLFDATKRFLSYDPLKETASIPELTRELKSALIQSSSTMTGPAAVILANELIHLREGLEKIVAAGGPMAADAQALDQELEPLIKGARVLAEHADAPERFTAMMDAYTDKLKKSRAAGLKRDVLGWSKSAGEALAALMKADHAQMAAELDRVEKDFFPELLAKRQPKEPQAEAVETAPVIKSRVADLMSARGYDDGSSGDHLRLRRIGNAQDRSTGTARGVVNTSGPGGGDSGTTPPPIEGPYGRVEDAQGLGQEQKAPKLDRQSKIGELGRETLPGGKITERSDKLRAIELPEEDLRAMKKKMNEKLAKSRKSEDVQQALKDEILTEFAAFIAEHEDLVNKLADDLRQHPGLETVVVVDQSGSTFNSRQPRGPRQIIEQERATLAIIMAAHMRAERNLAVVGFGSNRIGAAGDKPVTSSLDRDHYQEVSVFVHKPMAERLDEAWADKAYGVCGNADGYTDLIEPMNVAAGQFTDRANNKLILVLTDAQIGNAPDVKRFIENRREEHIGVAVIGFGDARHVTEVAGDIDNPVNPGFGMHVHNFAEAIAGGARLLTHTVVQNAGYRGKVKSAAQGIGATQNQEPMRAAHSQGPMDCVLEMAEPVVIGSDPGDAFGARGKRREMHNLVDRSVYERALRELELSQGKNAKNAKFRECMRQVAEMRARHEREGLIESLRESVSMSLPKTRGAEWERKQVSGPLFDEQELPMYVVGLAQGVPVWRIFKRKRPTEDTKATVVLAIDESSSMGDSEKMKAHIEALIAYGDALKAADPDIKIAVVGFSDKVRLHAGFEQDWDETLKAHLLYQIGGNYDATDDERGGRESIGLLNMMEADVGQIVSFSDGQGMPGMLAVHKLAAEEGYASMTVGITPDSKMVRRFDKHGVYARNLAQLPLVLPGSAVAVWEEAGRIIT